MESGDSLMVFDALANRPPESGYAVLDLRGGFVVLDFDDSADEQAVFFSVVPVHYTEGGLLFTLSFTTTSATTGTARLRIEATRIAAGDSLDTLPVPMDTLEFLVSAPAAAGNVVEHTTGTVSATGLTAGEHLRIALTRLATDAGDTLTGDLELISMEVREA